MIKNAASATPANEEKILGLGLDCQLKIPFATKYLDSTQKAPLSVYKDVSLILWTHLNFNSQNWPCSKRAGDWVRKYFFCVRAFNID